MAMVGLFNGVGSNNSHSFYGRSRTVSVGSKAVPRLVKELW